MGIYTHAQSCPTQSRPPLCDPMDCGILQARTLEPLPSPGDLPNPGIKPRSPTLQADSLPAEPQGKPKNTGVGSLSVLQRIFPTQELNWGLMHCRQILSHLSYQGSPTEIQGRRNKPHQKIVALLFQTSIVFIRNMYQLHTKKDNWIPAQVQLLLLFNH